MRSALRSINWRTLRRYRRFAAASLKDASHLQNSSRNWIEPSRRARQLQAEGFSVLDALHLASAEQAGVDYFLTCDDRLVRRYSGKLKVVNPQAFINSLGEKQLA